MDDCPRCGGPFATYSLEGQRSRACSNCGYVGVAVDHASTQPDPESWSDALGRFYDQYGDTDPDEEDGEEAPTDDEAVEPDGTGGDAAAGTGSSAEP